MSDAKSVLDELERLGIRAQTLCADSRYTKPGDVFVALKGKRVDGRNYISQAIDNGAIAVIYEAGKLPVGAGDKPIVIASDIGRFLGELASNVYGNPSQKMWIAGITGTNGKTSVSQWIAQALEALNEPCGVVGTLGNGFPGRLVESANTTPDAIALHTALARLVSAGAAACAMEVSSIGLDQHRVTGVNFNVAVLTNLSRDHLDYHGDMSSYAIAKETLFDMPEVTAAVLNLDDRFGRGLAAKLNGRMRIIGYSLEESLVDKSCCDQLLVAKNPNFRAAGLEFDLNGQRISAPVVGRFNVANLLAVIGALLVRGHELPTIAGALATIEAPPGRMQSIGGTGEPLVVIDYAHTPDALEKALSVLRETADSRAGKLICVFGCGGARDPGKRPHMGAVAETFADRVMVTSDNPRNEDPELIAADILKGMHGRPRVELDRGSAITLTISAASSQDVVLLAGKGHESYQEINGLRLPFSDMQVAQLVLTARRQASKLSLEHGR